MLPEPQKGLDSNTKIDDRTAVSGGVHDYILVFDREHYSTKLLERYEYEDFVVYILLTSYGEPSFFREPIYSQEKDKWMGFND